MRTLKFLLAIAIAVCPFSSAVSQLLHIPSLCKDSLHNYPFIYHYYMPDTTLYHDSVYCKLKRDFYEEPEPSLFGFKQETALFQHTDDTLKIVGIGFSTDFTCHLYMVTLYDSNMNVIMQDTGSFDAGSYVCTTLESNSDSMVPADTAICNILWFPSDEITHAKRPLHHDMILLDRRVFFTFKKSVSVVGDFWIAHRSQYSQSCPTVWFLEDHDPPYRFNDIRVRNRDRHYNNNEWVDTTVSGKRPIIFALIEPECLKVEDLTVTCSPSGTIDAVWQGQARQSQWTLYLDGPEGRQEYTRDTNFWHYDATVPGVYQVSVDARCYNLNGYSWSGSCAPVSVTLDGDGIAAAPDSQAPDIELLPNPASRQVAVKAPCSEWQLEVHDARGVLVHSASVSGRQSATIDLGGWAAGQYVVTVSTPQGSASRLLTVAR